MGLTGQLLFFLFCFHCLSSSESQFVVRWDSSGPSDINNHLDVILNDVIRFNCTNEVSNVFRVESEQAYSQCDTNAAGSLVGNCQADVPVVSALIIEAFGDYQTGNRYYFYSTHGSDCANGLKLSIDVLEARPTTASSTVNPTGTSTSGAVTGTITGSTGTITGSTTSSSSATSTSPTVGGSDDSGSSFLEKLPLREYFLVIVAGVIILLLLIIVLPVSIMCFRKRKGSMALVKPHQEEKGTYEKMESAVGEKNKAVKSEEKTKEKSEIKKDEKIEGKTAKDKVEIKKADNGNAIVSYKRNEEEKLSPRTNIRRPPPPPTNNSVPKTAGNNSVPKTTSSNSVPKTASSSSNAPKTASSITPKTTSSITPKTASSITPVRNNNAPSTTTDPKSLPASMNNKQVSSGPSRMNNQTGPQSLPAARRPAPTPNSLPASHKRPAPPPPST